MIQKKFLDTNIILAQDHLNKYVVEPQLFLEMQRKKAR